MEEKLLEILENEIQELSSKDNELRETLIAVQDGKENIQEKNIAGLLKDKKQLEEAIENEKMDYIKAEFTSDLKKVNDAINNWEQTQLQEILSIEKEIDSKRKEEEVLEEYKREKTQNENYNQDINERRAELEHRKSEAEAALNELTNNGKKTFFREQPVEKNEIENDLEKISAELERINNEQENENNRFAEIETRYNDLCDKYNVKEVIEEERRQAEEAARREAEEAAAEEARRQAEEAARREAEEAARREAEEAARREAEEAARRQAEEAAAEEARRQAEEAAEEAKKKGAEEEEKAEEAKGKKTKSGQKYNLNKIFEYRDEARKLLPKALKFVLEKHKNGEKSINFKEMKEKLGINEEVFKRVKSLLIKFHVVSEENGTILLSEKEIREYLEFLDPESKDSNPEGEHIMMTPEKYDEYLTKNMIQNDKEYVIEIGKTAKLYHNGTQLKPYSLKDYRKTAVLNEIWEKDGLKGFKDRTINQLKNHFTKETLELIKECDNNKVPIDFMVLYTIKNCNDLSIQQKDNLAKEYLKSNINAYKKFDSIENNRRDISEYNTDNNLTVKYDMTQLSEVSLTALLPDWFPIKSGLNGKQKEQIASLANKFQRLGTAITIGRYSRRFNELNMPKILNLGIFKKAKQRLLPAPENMKTPDYTNANTLKETMISKEELEAAYKYNDAFNRAKANNNNIRKELKAECAKTGKSRENDYLKSLALSQERQEKNRNKDKGNFEPGD